MKNICYKIWWYLVILQQKWTTLYYLVKYWFAIDNRGVKMICGGFLLRNIGDKNTQLNIILNKNSRIKYKVIIQGKGVFELGKNSYLSHHVIIGVNEKVSIGDNCMVASYVSIRDTDHKFDDLKTPMINQGIKTSPITIEDNVWIGHGAVITKGVTIESGAIIAANAVISKDVPKNAIMGGVPAKIIKYRDD